MKKTIIILHGWGISGKKYHVMKALLEKKGYSVFTPDLPGFGEEKMVKEVMNIDDYVDFIRRFVEQHKLTKIILVAHSNGGRIAVKFAAKYPTIVEKMVIMGSPLVKQKLSMKKQTAYLLAKTYRRFFSFMPENIENSLRKLLYFSIREWDYYKAGEMKRTFQKLVSEDLTPILKKVSSETLLVWADHDTLVPLSVGVAAEKLMPHASLLVMANKTHKLPYEDPTLFVNTIIKFL